MCTGGAWSDVCLLNISSRGLQLQSASPPPRGSYVEIRRGHLVIIARVAWTKGHRFGVRTQDCLPIEAICSEPGKSEPAKSDAGTGDRRSAPRPAASSHEHNRHVARAMEFACLLIVVGGAASILYGTVSSALAKPLSAVTAGLEGR